MFVKHVAMKFYMFIGLAICLAVYCDQENNFDNEMVRLTPDNTEYSHSVNDARMITCDGADIRWFDPRGNNVENKGRVHVESVAEKENSEMQQLRLIFPRIEEEDYGKWTCEGKYSKQSFLMKIYVPISFDPVEQEISTLEGHDVELECRVIGNPKPKIKWYFGDQDLIENEQTEDVEIHHSRLYLRNVSRMHGGEYYCRAYQYISDTIDLKQQVIQLNVQFKPEIVLDGQMALSGYINDIKTGKTIKYGFLNGTLNLTCEASANPLPTFIWYHNGKKISHHHIHQVDEETSVVVMNLNSEKKFGDYKCLVRNIFGTDFYVVTVKKGVLPPKPNKIELIGRSNTSVEVNVGSKKDTSGDPMAIYEYRFELMKKEDLESNETEWFVRHIEAAESGKHYIIANLIPNTTYLAKVAAVNIMGLSEFTDTHEFTTINIFPNSARMNFIGNFPFMMISILFIRTLLQNAN